MSQQGLAFGAMPPPLQEEKGGSLAMSIVSNMISSSMRPKTERSTSTPNINVIGDSFGKTSIPAAPENNMLPQHYAIYATTKKDAELKRELLVTQLKAIQETGDLGLVMSSMNELVHAMAMLTRMETQAETYSLQAKTYKANIDIIKKDAYEKKYLDMPAFDANTKSLITVNNIPKTVGGYIEELEMQEEIQHIPQVYRYNPESLNNIVDTYIQSDEMKKMAETVMMKRSDSGEILPVSLITENYSVISSLLNKAGFTLSENEKGNNYFDFNGTNPDAAMYLRGLAVKKGISEYELMGSLVGDKVRKVYPTLFGEVTISSLTASNIFEAVDNPALIGSGAKQVPTSTTKMIKFTDLMPYESTNVEKTDERQGKTNPLAWIMYEQIMKSDIRKKQYLDIGLINLGFATKEELQNPKTASDVYKKYQGSLDDIMKDSITKAIRANPQVKKTYSEDKRGIFTQNNLKLDYYTTNKESAIQQTKTYIPLSQLDVEKFSMFNNAITGVISINGAINDIRMNKDYKSQFVVLPKYIDGLPSIVKDYDFGNFRTDAVAAYVIVKKDEVEKKPLKLPNNKDLDDEDQLPEIGGMEMTLGQMKMNGLISDKQMENYKSNYNIDLNALMWLIPAFIPLEDSKYQADKNAYLSTEDKIKKSETIVGLSYKKAYGK